MSNPTSRATLVRLRRAVVAGEMTSAQAAESVGIPRGTLASRWRYFGLVAAIPSVPRASPTKAMVARLIAEDPTITDAEVARKCTESGWRINESTARVNRVALGIPTQRKRMEAIDPNWRHPDWPQRVVSDAALVEARRKIVARESTIRRQAVELGIATQTMYHHWRRMGLLGERPTGGADDSRPRSQPPSPVRDEVAAHLREYPWMTAHDIADSMTADGYPIKASCVQHHIRIIRRNQGAE